LTGQGSSATGNGAKEQRGKVTETISFAGKMCGKILWGKTNSAASVPTLARSFPLGVEEGQKSRTGDARGKVRRWGSERLRRNRGAWPCSLPENRGSHPRWIRGGGGQENRVAKAPDIFALKNLSYTAYATITAGQSKRGHSIVSMHS